MLLIDDALTAIQWKIESPKCRGDKGVITLTGSDLDKIRQVLLGGESMPLSDIYFVFPGTHTLELISEGACQTDSTFEISVAAPSPYKIIPDELTLEGNATGFVAVAPAPPGGTVSWSPENFVLCATCAETEVLSSAEGNLSLTIKDVNGCTYLHSISINRIEDTQIIVPNAFSPNGDGVNDEWEVLIPGDKMEVIDLQIYDRWGGLMHQSTGPRWDGKFNGDRKVNPGVYAWKVKTKSKSSGQVYVHSGELTVVW